jgi:hypothetical protein
MRDDRYRFRLFFSLFLFALFYQAQEQVFELVLVEFDVILFVVWFQLLHWFRVAEASIETPLFAVGQRDERFEMSTVDGLQPSDQFWKFGVGVGVKNQARRRDVKRCGHVQGPLEMELAGLEPATSWVRYGRSER